MSVAIQRKDSGLIWFDAVLQLSRNLSGSVSQHPLEDGAVNTDQTTLNNEQFTISGLLSDADFNTSRPLLDSDPNLGAINKQWINNTPVNPDGTYSNVSILDPSGQEFNTPEFVSQFLNAQRPIVSVTAVGKTKPALTVAEELVTMFNAREAFVLLDFRNGILHSSYDNCVMTSLAFNEDSDSGDGVYPEITIERVKYAVSASVQIQKRSAKDIENAAAKKQNKGAKTGTSQSTNKDMSADSPSTATRETSSGIKDEGSQRYKEAHSFRRNGSFRIDNGF